MKQTQKQIRDLAIACALWRLSAESRPLTPDYPAEDDAANDEWAAGRSVEHDQAVALLARVDVQATLRLLADRGAAGEAARAVAREAQARRFGLVVSPVHGFGPGWREMPSVALGGAS